MLISLRGQKSFIFIDNTFNLRLSITQKNSDCFLEGYIEDYDRRGHFAHLSVDGEIGLRDTGEKIFLFQTSIMIDLKTQNPKTVAYQIGGAIAHFIGSKS